MACGARWGLKPGYLGSQTSSVTGLNGLWSPLGIETLEFVPYDPPSLRLNGLWSPLGIETPD